MAMDRRRHHHQRTCFDNDLAAKIDPIPFSVLEACWVLGGLAQEVFPLVDHAAVMICCLREKTHLGSSRNV